MTLTANDILGAVQLGIITIHEGREALGFPKLEVATPASSSNLIVGEDK